MGRTLSVTICALLLLMSYASGPSKDITGRVAEDGYEWTLYEGDNYYRTPNSGTDWQVWQDN